MIRERTTIDIITTCVPFSPSFLSSHSLTLQCFLLLQDDVDPNGIAPIHYRDILTELMTIRKVRNYCFMHLDRYTTGTEQLFAEHIATIKEAVFQVVSMDQGKNKPDYQVFLQAVLKQTGQSIYNSVAFDTRQLPPDA